MNFTRLGLLFALAVIVLAIKFSIRRRRPEGEWGAMYRKTDPHSFPSGHATLVFGAAVVLLRSNLPRWARWGRGGVVWRCLAGAARGGFATIVLTCSGIICWLGVRAWYWGC